MAAGLFHNLDNPHFKYKDLTCNVIMKDITSATRGLTQFQSCVLHSSKISHQLSYHTWSQHSKPVTSCQTHFLSTVSHSKTKCIPKHNAYISLFFSFCLPICLATQNMIFHSCKTDFLNSFSKRY